jgi:hypothetical protein
MQHWRSAFAVAFLAAIVVFAFPYSISAQEENPPDGSALSPYWSPVVSRWEPMILQYAHERSLDPDLVAAVIWKESRGRPTERSIAGAIGLMQLMPRPWRPSPEELENPWTNLFWGARALAHTIRDGNGDLYYALAAYNGGWDQIHLRVTRRYATTVLDSYSRAVAVRHGLSADGDWIAIFAVEGVPGSSTITVLGPRRPLARYTERPWIQADVPTVPVGVPPHATVITFVNGQGVEGRVYMWLVSEDGSPITLSAVQAVSSSRHLAVTTSPDVR